MIVPQYGSSEITVFVWGKNMILKFVVNTKYKSMKLTLQLVVVVLIAPTKLPRPHFLGRPLIWPGYFSEHILGLFGLHPSSLSNSAGFVFLSGKASLVSISADILLLRSWHVYFLLEFEFRGKSCVE